jgi:hypothetical protein
MPRARLGGTRTRPLARASCHDSPVGRVAPRRPQLHVACTWCPSEHAVKRGGRPRRSDEPSRWRRWRPGSWSSTSSGGRRAGHRAGLAAGRASSGRAAFWTPPKGRHLQRSGPPVFSTAASSTWRSNDTTWLACRASSATSARSRALRSGAAGRSHALQGTYVVSCSINATPILWLTNFLLYQSELQRQSSYRS